MAKLFIILAIALIASSSVDAQRPTLQDAYEIARARFDVWRTNLVNQLGQTLGPDAMKRINDTLALARNQINSIIPMPTPSEPMDESTSETEQLAQAYSPTAPTHNRVARSPQEPSSMDEGNVGSSGQMYMPGHGPGMPQLHSTTAAPSLLNLFGQGNRYQNLGTAGPHATAPSVNQMIQSVIGRGQNLIQQGKKMAQDYEAFEHRLIGSVLPFTPEPMFGRSKRSINRIFGLGSATTTQSYPGDYIVQGNPEMNSNGTIEPTYQLAGSADGQPGAAQVNKRSADEADSQTASSSLSPRDVLVKAMNATFQTIGDRFHLRRPSHNHHASSTEASNAYRQP